MQAGSRHGRTGKNACATPSIAAKRFLQPIVQLTKEQLQISAGRLFEKFYDARAEILPGVIDRSEKMHIGPEIAVLPAAKDFFGIRQPIEIFTGKPKSDRSAQTTLLDRYFSLHPEFSSLFDGNVIEVDPRVFPSKAERTVIQLQMFE